jgi:hypothetical protein
MLALSRLARFLRVVPFPGSSDFLVRPNDAVSDLAALLPCAVPKCRHVAGDAQFQACPVHLAVARRLQPVDRLERLHRLSLWDTLLPVHQ